MDNQVNLRCFGPVNIHFLSFDNNYINVILAFISYDFTARLCTTDFSDKFLGMHRYHFFQYSVDTILLFSVLADTEHRYWYFHCTCKFFKYWVQKPK